MVSETKIDDTFPESPFMLDLTAKGRVILIYIREDIPCRYIKQITVNSSLEGSFAELSLRS